MQQRHKVFLGSSGETVLPHLKLKQYDIDSHQFLVQFTDTALTFSETDNIKAVAYNRNKTLDIIVCSKSTDGQNATFTLTEASLYYSGTLLIELNVFNNTGKVKWTSPAFAIDVIPSAKGNVQNIDIESSLSSELLNIARTVNNKVDKYQGSSNSGKYLAVNDRGYVTLVDPPQAVEPYQVLTATHNLVETDTNYEILSKSEVEI